MNLTSTVVATVISWRMTVTHPGIIFRGSATNSIEVREQIERGSGGGSPLVRGSPQFANG
jgi:hypothetical protein